MRISPLLILLVASASSAKVNESFISNFTGSVYKGILQNGAKSNFLVSPLSLATLVALIQSGAKGPSAEEIRTVLQLPDDQKEIEAIFKNLLTTINKQLGTTNKLYIKERYRIKEGFTKLANEVFGTDLEKVEFANRFKTIKTINQWVMNRTQNKINYVVDNSNVDSNTRAVLINAGYLELAVPFVEIKKEKFQSKKAALVDFLHHKRGRYNYSESPELGAKFLELPFQNGDISMVIVLPENLTDLEKKIDLGFAPPSFTPQLVNFSLPKFKIENKISFKPILQKLGVRKVFTYGEADLGGITSERASISGVIQKTFITIDGVAVGEESAEPDQEVKEFRVDRPFMFYIKVGGLLAFAGRVAELVE